MISVCMATYNGERFIKEQIASILPQLSENDELIISDDGSMDRTLEIIDSFNDSRIHVLHHRHNPKYEKIKHSRNFYYVTENFENALKEAKGDFIFLSDQDDVWAGNKVNKMIEALQNFDLVMSNFAIIDENEKVIQEKVYEVSPVKKSIFQYLVKFKMIGCCLAFTRKALNRSVPFPEKLLAHDFWICCCNVHSTKFVDEPLHLYRRHGENVSFGTEISSNSLIYKIMYRLELGLLILKNYRQIDI